MTSFLRLRNDLGHQLGVLDGLSTLHNTYDCGLGLVLPVFGNLFMGCLVFCFGLFHLDLVDFDPILRIRKSCIDAECVCRVHITPFRMFGEDSIFGARKRLEGNFQLFFRFNSVSFSLRGSSSYIDLRRPDAARICEYVRWSFSAISLKSNTTTA